MSIFSKILTFILMLFICVESSYAITPRTVLATCDANKITGNFDSFNVKYIGANTESNTITILDNGSPITGMNNVAVKISRRTESTNLVFNFLSTDNNTVKILNISNVVFVIPYTNIPTVGMCNCEIWAWQGNPTNITRTLAQGKIQVLDSLYASNDGLFPYPQSSLIDYVRKDDPTYLSIQNKVNTNDLSYLSIGSKVPTNDITYLSIPNKLQLGGDIGGLTTNPIINKIQSMPVSYSNNNLYIGLPLVYTNYTCIGNSSIPLAYQPPYNGPNGTYSIIGTIYGSNQYQTITGDGPWQIMYEGDSTWAILSLVYPNPIWISSTEFGTYTPYNTTYASGNVIFNHNLSTNITYTKVITDRDSNYNSIISKVATNSPDYLLKVSIDDTQYKSITNKVSIGGDLSGLVTNPIVSKIQTISCLASNGFLYLNVPVVSTNYIITTDYTCSGWNGIPPDKQPPMFGPNGNATIFGEIAGKTWYNCQGQDDGWQIYWNNADSWYILSVSYEQMWVRVDPSEFGTYVDDGTGNETGTVVFASTVITNANISTNLIWRRILTE